MTSSTDLRICRRFESAVLQAVRGPCGVVVRRGPAETLDPLLVAVSGGPDSLALLHALVRVSGRVGRRRAAGPPAIHAAYFDHGLREPALVAEEGDFVAGQAAALGVGFVTGRADVRALARRRHLSLEDAARRCRYAFLREKALELGVDVVAAGHTASDQAETVLLRVLRGTGVAGLGAMDWRAPWPTGDDGPQLVRPLLALRREDTRAYCAALGLAPRHDAENDSSRYRRNRVRHELLPLLRGYNPQIVSALSGLAASAREAQQLVVRVLDAHWQELARVEAEGVSLARGALVALPAAVRAEAFRRAAALVAGEPQPPERVHVRAMESLLSGPSGRVVELPGGVRAQARTDVVHVGQAGAGENAAASATGGRRALVGEWPLAAAGETRLPGWRIWAVEENVAEIIPGDPSTAWLRQEVFAERVVVSGRRPGDRIRPLGMAGEKKVHDLLVDARIPRVERDGLPIVRSGARVAWVVGVRVADWAAAQPGEPAVRVAFRSAP